MTLPTALLAIGAILLAASIIFDLGDLGDFTGKTSLPALGIATATIGATQPHLGWVAAVAAGAASHILIQLVENSLRRRGTDETPPATSLIGYETIIVDATDKQGRNGTITIPIDGVGQRVLADHHRPTPLPAGATVWVESIDETSSRAIVRLTQES